MNVIPRDALGLVLSYGLYNTDSGVMNNTTVYEEWPQGSGSGEWVEPGCKTVDFGTNDQTVSAEFYNWFTANATRID